MNLHKKSFNAVCKWKCIPGHDICVHLKMSKQGEQIDTKIQWKIYASHQTSSRYMRNQIIFARRYGEQRTPPSSDIRFEYLITYPASGLSDRATIAAAPNLNAPSQAADFWRGLNLNSEQTLFPARFCRPVGCLPPHFHSYARTALVIGCHIGKKLFS